MTPDRRTVMAAEVSYAPSFKIDVPASVFKAIVSNTGLSNSGSYNFNWDVAADGKKFLLATVATQDNVPQPPISVVLNWQEELKRMVPTR